MNTTTSWTLPGSDDQLIYGDTHLPEGPPCCVVLLAHGFKGYKDYGFFPRLADRLASQGCVVHRFNFSHSGMTPKIETFARPDLFEKETWNRQIHDLHTVANAVANKTLAGGSLGQVWVGHSRGGVTTLLAAGRAFDQGLPVQPRTVVTLAAGDDSCSLTEDQRRLLHKQGWLESPSGRTGQKLRIGLDWLLEQEANPDAFDPKLAAAHLRCPLLIVHGKDDPTVPYQAALSLATAADDHATVVIMDQANHVFDAPNPLPAGQALPDATQAMFDHVTAFITRTKTS